jgi:hypothetical protein
VGVAGTLPGEDAVMGIVDREPGNGGAEGGSQFHALEDEVDSELMAALQASQVGTDVVLLADPFFGPLHRDMVFAGEGFHPAVVIDGPLTQDLFADGVDVVEVTEEVDNVLGAGKQGQMTEDDDTVETVVYQGQQAVKQLCKGLHRSSPVVLASATRSSARRPVEIKAPHCGTGQGKKGSRERNRRFRSLAQLRNPHSEKKSTLGRKPSLSKFQICLGRTRGRYVSNSDILHLR